MSITWIRVSLDLPEHPKLQLLESAIGESAFKAIFRVWRFAAKARRDGRLADPREAEIAAQWTGHPGALHEALVASGFLEADGVTIHDWMHNQGDALATMMQKRQITADRVRRHRAKMGGTPPIPPHVTTTATATATGNALRNAPCNALRNAPVTRDEHPDAPLPPPARPSGERTSEPKEALGSPRTHADSLDVPNVHPSVPPCPGAQEASTEAVGDNGKDEPPGFSRFWGAYPRRTGKGAARKAWVKLKPNLAVQQAIQDALAWQVKSEQWLKQGGQFIPHPATWLNQNRWEDEPETAPVDTRTTAERLGPWRP